MRALSLKWPPKNAVKKAARIDRGIYMCTGYQCNPHSATASIVVDGKRKDNIFVDHIIPVVDPNEGFTSWDEVIRRLFCDSSDLQVLCSSCHHSKTLDEKALRKNDI